jgi:hypothetical protein
MGVLEMDKLQLQIPTKYAIQVSLKEKWNDIRD